MNTPSPLPAAPAGASMAELLVARLSGCRSGPGWRGRRGHGKPAAPIAAAVLVALLIRPAGPTILMTRRASRLRDHGGQISFPGGRMEAADSDAEATALREASEETGITPGEVAVLGRLDRYLIPTGYEVTPVIGLIAGDVRLTADPAEVAEIFEMPLSFLLDTANHGQAMSIRDRHRQYVLYYREHMIWGATAGMLINLYELLTGPS